MESGHTNIRDLIKISREVNGMECLWHLPSNFKLDPPCLICHVAKSRARPLLKGPVERAAYIHHRVFMDTSGKRRVRAHNGDHYSSLAVDNHSDFTNLWSHQLKSDLKGCCNERNVRHGFTPKILRTN